MPFVLDKSVVTDNAACRSSWTNQLCTNIGKLWVKEGIGKKEIHWGACEANNKRNRMFLRGRHIITVCWSVAYLRGSIATMKNNGGTMDQAEESVENEGSI
jgi:hypothetical protein